MKIKINKWKNYWYHNIANHYCIQKKYDYVFKYLDFDKVDKNRHIYFNDYKVKKWFGKAYINEYGLNKIYNNSPLGYQWLKKHWGKSIFKLFVCYIDKQELKTIINRVINIELRS